MNITPYKIRNRQKIHQMCSVFFLDETFSEFNFEIVLVVEKKLQK